MYYSEKSDEDLKRIYDFVLSSMKREKVYI